MAKKRLSMILMIFIACYSVSAASASEYGIFRELAMDEYADERLAGLDQVAETLEASLTTEDGARFEIGQGCYVGNHVFIAYRICAVTDLITLYEGAPDEGTEWDQVIEDWIMGDLKVTGYPDVDKENQWLDGKGQRWLECPYCHNEEYLELADGTYLDFTAGTEMKLEDGTVIGWRECLIPMDTAQDTESITFVVPVSYGKAIKFQDYSTFRENFGVEQNVGISITLHHLEETP